MVYRNRSCWSGVPFLDELNGDLLPENTARWRMLRVDDHDQSYRAGECEGGDAYQNRCTARMELSGVAEDGWTSRLGCVPVAGCKISTSVDMANEIRRIITI